MAMFFQTVTSSSAADCQSYNSDARAAGSSSEWSEDDGWVVEKYGTVCTITDRDQGQFDYYTTSEATCRSMPGFIEWFKDRGAGFNRCLFDPGGAGGGGSDSDDPGGSGGGGTDDGGGYTNDPPPAAPSGPNSCSYAFDNTCDEPYVCDPGTDTSDCRAQVQTPKPAPPKPQQPQSPYVDFTLCNRTNQTIYVAYGAKRDVDDQYWKFSGWRHVEGQHCDLLGRFVKGYIYIHGDGARDGKWGKDKSFCVKTAKFDYYRDGVGQCSERTEKFSEILAKSDTYTFELTE